MMLFPYLLTATGCTSRSRSAPRIPILAAALCLPAGFVLSLLTPLAIKLGLPDVAHTGRVAGLIFAFSTLGLSDRQLRHRLLPRSRRSPSTRWCWSPPARWSCSRVVAASTFPTAENAPPGVGTDFLPPATTEDVPPATTNPHAFLDIRQAYLIVFLASFCGMTLELTASRMLAQVLGVSLFTWTGIIGVMLAGTALGNFTGGQIADAVNRSDGVNRAGDVVNPRHVLAWTLCGAAGAVVLALLLFAVLSRTEAFGQLGAITQVMTWTFSLFFLPMFLLGLVSPQVIRLAVPDVAHAGRVAGRVYAWSTAGAIVGTFATGYFLLSTLGVRNALLLSGLVLVGTSLVVTKVWENNSLLYLFSIVLGGVVGGFILGIRARNDDDLVAHVDSNYYTIKVTRDSGREGALKLTLDHLVHSSVDPDHPEYLYYTHEHIQMEFLNLARTGSAEPKVLVIGGGGYTFPRYAQEMMPQSHVDVVEIDPKVTAGGPRAPRPEGLPQPPRDPHGRAAVRLGEGRAGHL